MVVPELPAMGWTILRAAYVAAGSCCYASTQGGYKVPKYGYGDKTGVQVENIDGFPLLVEDGYAVFYLAIVHEFGRDDEIDRRPGVYDDRFKDFEARLLPMIEWMRVNDPLPGMFSEPLCNKGDDCRRTVEFSAESDTYKCLKHGRRKASQVLWMDLSPFENVPKPNI
jgi:hypothetical protein